MACACFNLTNIMYRKVGKIVIDRFFSVFALVILAPLFAVVVLLILLDGQGNALFKQQRVGLNQRLFMLYKFRTMTVNPCRVITQTVGNSDGVTAVGRCLRRLKIDELPQLLNVLLGDMSLVGPRPCLESYLSGMNAVGLRRFEVLPGLTGLAQVNGNIALTWEERWKFDARYVENLSLLLDVKIILKTLLVVIGGEHRFKSDGEI